jgi:hypothetical protein
LVSRASAIGDRHTFAVQRMSTCDPETITYPA